MTLMGLTRAVNARSRARCCYKGKDLLTSRPAPMQDSAANELGMIFQDPMTSLNPVYRSASRSSRRSARTRTSPRQARTSAPSSCSSRSASRTPRDARRRYPHEFSGGMRQRAMIAMAIVLQPGS